MANRRFAPVLLLCAGIACVLAAGYYALPVYRCSTRPPPPPGVVRGPCTLPFALYVVPLGFVGAVLLAVGGWKLHAVRNRDQ